jgi:hypothetical protein
MAKCVPFKDTWRHFRRYNPNILSDDSFLTNERSFCLAMLLSMVEHYLELSFIPSIKGWAPICALGAAGMIFGEFFRKGALYCAKHNFTHQIEDRNKRKEHRLVTVTDTAPTQLVS